MLYFYRKWTVKLDCIPVLCIHIIILFQTWVCFYRIESQSTTIIKIKINKSYIKITEIDPTEKIFTDQTGKFPITSSAGNRYILTLYEYGSNNILAEPTKSCTKEKILRTYKVLIDKIRSRGIVPKIQWLDNVVSEMMKDFITENEIEWKLVPPNCHRRNA